MKLRLREVKRLGELLKRGAGRVIVSLGEQRQPSEHRPRVSLNGKIWKMYPETQKRVFSCSLCVGLRANPNRTINSPPQGSCHRSPLVPSVWRVVLNRLMKTSGFALGMGAIDNHSSELPSVRTEPHKLWSGDLIHYSRLLADGVHLCLS